MYEKIRTYSRVRTAIFYAVSKARKEISRTLKLLFSIGAFVLLRKLVDRRFMAGIPGIANHGFSKQWLMGCGF
jgi:hypothetical protein